MGLSSLKRKPITENVAHSCSVDAFIEDADAYAAGFPQIVSVSSQRTDRRSHNRTAQMAISEPEGGTYRHATFSLTVDAIEHLSVLAKRDQFNKSKLIRILIEHQMGLSKSERVKIYKKVITQ